LKREQESFKERNRRERGKVEEELQLGVGSLFGNKDRSEKQDRTSECALASQPLLPRFQ